MRAVALHVLSATGLIPSVLLPDVAALGRPLAVTATVYYGVKAVVFLAAGTVAICTKDDKRRETCLEIVRIVCRGWPRPPRPGSGAAR